MPAFTWQHAIVLTKSLMTDYEVAVVGGGLVGVAIAWGLAKKGVKTLLLDEGDNAIRTARGNFGLVWLQGKGVGLPPYTRWTLQSIRAWPEFAQTLECDTGIDVAYDKPGGYHLCIDQPELDDYAAVLDGLQQAVSDPDYTYELLDQAELKHRLPLVGDIAGAVYCPHDGHCNPLRLFRAMHEAYHRLGDYRPRSKVTEVRPVEGGGFALHCEERGTSNPYSAEKVVLAAGLGSQRLASALGLEIPVSPNQGQVIVTERVQPMLGVPTNLVRQTDEGAFLLGASAQDVGFDLATDSQTLKEIAARCAKSFPFIRKLNVQRAWAALRIMTPDGCPIYQQSSQFPAAFSFSCHSGVTLAANHANYVADWVHQGEIPAEYDVFHSQRFH